MTTHVGKIGRLAQLVRHELSERIENGQRGVEIVHWPNGHRTEILEKGGKKRKDRA